MPTRIATYFSHSYRPTDRELNLAVWRICYEEGLRFSVDAKSDTLSTFCLELLMRRSAAFVGIVPVRRDQPVQLCSPYMLYEYGLAVQTRRPRLLLLESGVGARVLKSAGPDALPFERPDLDSPDTVEEVRQRIRSLAKHALVQKSVDRSQKRRVGLVFAPGDPVYDSTFVLRIEELLKDAGYEPEAVKLDIDRTYEFVQEIDGFDFVVIDVSGTALLESVHSLVLGRAIPAIRLFHLAPGAEQLRAPIPPLVKGLLLRGGTGMEDAVVFWQDRDELFARLVAHLTRADAVRTDFKTLEEGERYLRSAGREAARVFISNAADANDFATRLSSALMFENIPHFQYRENNTIRLGDPWKDALKEELERCSIFLMLITAGYWRSEWCQREFEWANERLKAGRLRIVPYMLERTTGPNVLAQGRDLSATPDNQRVTQICGDLDAMLVERTPAARVPTGTRDGEQAAGETGRRDVDLAILTVLPEEYEAVVKVLSSHRPFPGTLEQPNQFGWELGEVDAPGRGRPYRVVVALIGSAGNVSSTTATQQTLSVWQPRYVLLVGIAGGFPVDDLAQGDVLVSNVVWDYEYGRLTEAGFTPRQNYVFQVDRSLLTAAQTMSMVDREWSKLLGRPGEGRPEPKVRFGPFASGNKVIDTLSDPFVSAIRKQWPKLMGVEMEAAGAAQAVQTIAEKAGPVGFLMIRGISDLPPPRDPEPAQSRPADPSAQAQAQTRSRDEWKVRAARCAAAFAGQLVRTRWPVPPRD